MRPETRLLACCVAAVGFVAGGVALPAAGAAEPTPQQAIETRLMCYCGCADLTVRVCTCGTADAIRAEIADRLARGETPEAVVAAFVARHGEQILSAPTKEGFNLVAWVAPFAVLIAAGGLLVLAVRRWGAAGASTAPTPAGPGGAAPPGGIDRDLLQRVEREIREGR